MPTVVMAALLLFTAAALAPAATDRLSVSGLPLESTFSFTLGGAPSAALLPKWQKTMTTYPLRGSGNRTRTRTIYFQPGAGPQSTADCSQRSTAAVCDSFGVQLIVDAVSYPIRGGHTGTEWTLEFRNTATNSTPPLCAVRTLDAAMAMADGANLTVSTYGGGAFVPPARVIGGDGSGCAGNGCQGKVNGDGRFCPTLASFPAGASKALASSGRSSDAGLGFWSAFTTAAGSGAATAMYSGITASIGWSGYWTASLNRSRTSLQLQAGQGEFCAPIPPGDAFTFPRVLVVEWEGDSPQVGANAHRRVVVDYKIGRNPRTNEPVGMTSESNGCSDRCGGADSWRVYNLTTQLWHLKALQLTGVEGLWMDASWFKGDFGPNGNWALPISAMIAVGETVILLHPPSTFSRCFNRDKKGVSVK